MVDGKTNGQGRFVTFIKFIYLNPIFWIGVLLSSFIEINNFSSNYGLIISSDFIIRIVIAAIILWTIIMTVAYYIRLLWRRYRTKQE